MTKTLTLSSNKKTAAALGIALVLSLAMILSVAGPQLVTKAFAKSEQQTSKECEDAAKKISDTADAHQRSFF